MTHRNEARPTVVAMRVLDTRSAATAAVTASRLIISNERPLAGGISGVFNPVITPDGSKIVAAA